MIEISLATKTELKGRELKKTASRILITNVGSDIKDEDIVGTIYQQNINVKENFQTLETLGEQCKLKTTLKSNKNEELKNAILEE